MLCVSLNFVRIYPIAYSPEEFVLDCPQLLCVALAEKSIPELLIRGCHELVTCRGKF